MRSKGRKENWGQVFYACTLSVNVDEEAFDANAENAYSGDYPLARFLYVYVNRNPNEALDPLRAEFVKYVFSRNGQEDVLKDGYLPVPATVAREELQAVGITPSF